MLRWVYKNFLHIIMFSGFCILLNACSGTGDLGPTTATRAPKRATSKPYQIKGVWYYPQQHFEYDETGIASFYGGGDVFHGRPTAIGKIFDMNGITAAHKTLPLPCIAEITNLENGRQIKVEVDDRGPFIDGRIIDVSRRVAQLLGFEKKGTAKVRVRTLIPESLALNNMPPFPETNDKTVMLAEQNVSSINLLISEVANTSSQNDRSKSPPPKKQVANYTLTRHQVMLPQCEADPLSSHKNTGGRIVIHIGKYSDKGQAQTVANKLKSSNQVKVISSLQGVQQIYSVQLGPFSSMAHADRIADQLSQSGHLGARIIIN